MIKSSDSKFVIFFVFFTFSQQFSFAQVLTGRVTGPDQEPLPFATIYIAGTSTGTNTNTEGFYTLELAAGTHQIVFQYVGYKKVIKTIQITTEQLNYDVQLSLEAFQLREVVVNAAQEDPAYEVIRKAIANRKKHREAVASYTCQVYIKGLQRLDERPSKLLGYAVPLDTGIVYLSESIAKLEVQQPNRTKETMISSKVSGNASGFSFNQASQTLISFYDNLIKIDGLTERGFISPIASNALFFYKYQLVGTMTENGVFINKIKVVPKRKTDPTFEGYIYIVEDEWNLSSVNLTLTKDHQIEFLDRMRIKQVFAPLGSKVWFMISQHFDFTIDVWGFKGLGYFTVNYSDYHYVLNPKYHQEPSGIDDQPPMTLVPKSSRFSPKEKGNEILKIEKGANERDDLYWAKHRPVPLTAVEKQDYVVKDSLAVIMESQSYLDTLDKKKNKLSISKLLYTGYSYQNSYKGTLWRVKPLISTLQYNTVEGFLINVSFDYSIREDKRVKHRVTPQLRYGVASDVVYGQLQYDWYYDKIKKAKLSLMGGSYVSQINATAPILPLVNTLETLMNRRNYMKLYEKRYFNIANELEVRNGIHLKSSIEYAERSPLYNQTDYSFFYRDSRAFSSNAPYNEEDSNTSFDTHNALILNARIVLRPYQKYISSPDTKYNLGSKFPDIILRYRSGLNVLGGDLRFDMLSLNIKGWFTVGLLGEGNYFLRTGHFLNSSQMTFLDYKHFSTNQSLYAGFKLDQFQLLDYYQYSTALSWLEAHYVHHFNGYIINKIPLIKKSKVQAVASVHYLKTQSVDNYTELGLGIEHILKVGRLDYTFGMIGGQRIHGVRFGLGF